jgi:AFG3 family protein
MALLGQDKETDAKDPKTRNKFPSFGIYFLILILFVYGLNFFFGENLAIKEITWQEFVKNFVPEKDVSRLEVINGEQVYVYIKPESIMKDKFVGVKDKKRDVPHYFFRIGSVESFEKKLDEAQLGLNETAKIPVRYVKHENWLMNSLPWILPVVFFFLLWRYIFSKSPAGGPTMGGNIFNFGKSSAVMMKKKKDSLTFIIRKQKRK